MVDTNGQVLMDIDEAELLPTEDDSAKKIKERFIDWDNVLKNYGPRTQESIRKLLSEAQVSDSDPAALVIAAQFLAQLETSQAFIEVKQTLEDGKTDLNKAFEDQVLRLRGVISLAEEKLTSDSNRSLEEKKEDLLRTIKDGIALSLGNEQKRRHSRDNFKTMLTMGTAGMLVIGSMLVTGLFFTLANKPSTPVTGNDFNAIKNGAIWLNIAENNQETLDLCLTNRDSLGSKCAMSIPR